MCACIYHAITRHVQYTYFQSWFIYIIVCQNCPIRITKTNFFNILKLFTLHPCISIRFISRQKRYWKLLERGYWQFEDCNRHLWHASECTWFYYLLKTFFVILAKVNMRTIRDEKYLVENDFMIKWWAFSNEIVIVKVRNGEYAKIQK